MTKTTQFKPLDGSNLTMGDLVSIHNLIADAPATAKTFSQRSKAVDRINKIASEKGIDICERLKLVDGVYSLEPEQAQEEEKPPVSNVVPINRDPALQAAIEAGQGGDDKPKADEAPKAKGKKAKSEPKAPKGPSIRQVAEELLMEVTGKDADGRKTGHTYETILSKIKEKFPQANTSIACLRWYAVHMREKGTMPPTRPRAVPAKAAASEEPEQKVA
jgi:hypothetical protein